MSNEDPFDDLDKQLEEAEETSPATTDPTESATDPQSDDTSHAEDTTSSSETTTNGDQGGPAFEFNNAYQRSIYPRPESWDQWQDTLNFEVKRLLADHNIRDLEGREAHDAMVRLAAEHPEEWAHLILEAREITDR